MKEGGATEQNMDEWPNTYDHENHVKWLETKWLWDTGFMCFLG